MAASELLKINILPGQDCATLRLSGEIDLSTAPAVREAALSALQQFSTVLHIDLSGVSFMDSTGLEVLLATRRRAELLGGQLHLKDPTPAVLRVLEVTGVARLFEIETAAIAPAAPAAAIP
jgi:anti-anti-sigma factor